MPYFALVLIVFWSEVGLSQMKLDDYLSQVHEKNLDYKSATSKKEGSTLSRRESDLFFTPRFFSEYQTANDKALPSSPGFSYDEISTQSLSLGIENEFSFGLQAKIGHHLSKLNYVNGNAGGQPFEYNNWDAKPFIEVSLPLLKNRWGRQSRALQESTVESADLEGKAAELARAEILAQAESAYWVLAAAQESVRIQRESYQRSEALLKFIQDKARMNLRDRSDVLQARASLQASKLELQQAKHSELEAEREFNRIRGASISEVVPKLDSLGYETLLSVRLASRRPGDRLDLSLSTSELKLARASQIAQEEKNQPELTLFGSYALNGRDADTSKAFSNPYRDNRPTQAIGVRLSIPLALDASSDARQGARLKVRAAEEALRFKQFSQDHYWTDLVQKFTEAQDNLKITRTLVSSQKDKLTEERKQLGLGRSSLFNVLSFEQDTLRSELSQVQLALGIRQLKVQTRLYPNNPMETAP